MKVAYKTNGVSTTQSLTEWYFGKTFVKDATEYAVKHELTEHKVWKNGVGYLTVSIEK